jgi:3alpha(or 20beta)-hydroxysteroid dehydrogenase
MAPSDVGLRNRFEGRTVLVSGGAAGIGAAHVRGFAAEGGRVVFGDIDEEGGAALAAELGGKVRFVVHDVTDAAGWERIVATAEEEFGPVSVLVNNAAILPPFLPIEEVDVEDWRRVLEVNLTGSFFGIKYAVPSMRRAGGGSIVNTSSALGVMGTPNLSAYVSSKYGIRGLTQTAALELARDGIRVNSIHPGYTRTPMNAEVSEENTRDLPVPRFAEPQEVTAVAMFLASEEASFVTGAEYLVDGGAVTGAVEAIDPT